MLTGGLETTVSMLALGAVVLLQDPDAARRLREDDSAAEPYVEELLRYLTVVQVGFPRFARSDVMLGGKDMFAGDVVICSLSAARTATCATAPGLDGLDLDRDPVVPHLAFGHGLHRCIGAELARIELRMAYPALVRRFPDMQLAVAPADIAYRDTSIVYGLDSLPVTLQRVEASAAAG